MRNISHGGARQKPGRLARRWMRFWVKWNGPGLFGRLASRLASWAAPPHLDHVSLAYLAPRGFIDANATIYHSDLRLGENVYVAPGVCVIESGAGCHVSLDDKVAIHTGSLLETGQQGYIELGVFSSVHAGCQLKAYVEPIVIGEGVMIAANVAIGRRGCSGRGGVRGDKGHTRRCHCRGQPGACYQIPQRIKRYRHK
jgi:acetyltransferase-like isoleucine patch superfamily enzyme